MGGGANLNNLDPYNDYNYYCILNQSNYWRLMKDILQHNLRYNPQFHYTAAITNVENLISFKNAVNQSMATHFR